MSKKVKNKIKKLPKVISAFIMIFAMLISCFTPIVNVYAQSFGKGEHFIKLGLNNNGFQVDGVTINGVDWTSDDDEYHSTTDTYAIEINTTKKGDSYPNISYGGGFNDCIDKTARVEGNNYIFTLVVTSPPDTYIGAEIVDGPPITINATANITMNLSGNGIELHYAAEKPDEPDVADFKIGINSGHSDDIVPFTFSNVTFKDNIMPPNATGATTTNPIAYEYNYDGSGYVDFYINGGCHTEYTKIEINGVDYKNQAPHTQSEIFENIRGRASQFIIHDVPYNADGYDIVVVGERLPNDKLVGSFGWSYKKDTEPDYNPNEDSLISHGRLEFVQVKYIDLDNETHIFNSAAEYNNARFHDKGEIYEWKDGNKNYNDLRDAWGEALVPYGAELTLRIVPDEGYQLVGLTNNSGFETTDEVGVYKIVFNQDNMGNVSGNFHLGAIFTKVDNEVISTSSNIKSGNIEINTSNDQSFSNGTAKLEVNDIAGLSTEGIEDFENKATEQGYEVENYLDLSLYNTIYKGGKTDRNGIKESWDTQVDNISEDASITLELNDDMSGKDIAIIHEKHTGNTVTGYELIDAVYNEENNTITFDTNSFSNYAIVTKESENKTKYTVSFNSNGGSEVKNKKVISGNLVAEPEAPTNGNLVFDGWFEDETLTARFDFNTPITQNVTLYAKWIEPAGDRCIVSFNSNGGSEVESIEVIPGDLIAEPEAPINGNLVFDGWFEDETLTARFDFNTPITQNVTLYAKWKEPEKNESYTINDDNGIVISFNEEDGHNFRFNINDYLNISDEELEAAGITREMYNEILKGIINVTKKHGTLLSFYEIEVFDENDHQIHEGPFKIKIKMTDEMKKYDTLKIIFIDLDNGITTEEPISLKVEGEYLVGTLNHLSTYALLGSNTPKSPSTGDDTYIWMVILVISILALSLVTITAAKLKKSKLR